MQSAKYVFFRSGFLTALTLFVVGCGDSLNMDLHQSISANENALNLTEWELSAVNPTALFREWRKASEADIDRKERIQKDLCQELLGLEGQALSVFESEILNDENQELLKQCNADVQAKLESYYENERKRLRLAVNALDPAPSLNKFKFQPNNQVRDVSKGYFAVSGDVAHKEVVLTFDDGPSGRYTRSILRSLQEVEAKALFFELGKNVRLNPDIVKEVAAAGHGIGSHSTTHACLGNSRACGRSNGRLLSFEEAAEEIRGGHQAIYDVLGWVDPFFRFPYGESSPELKSFLKDNQTAEFFWAVDSEDWRAQTSETLLSNTLNRLEKRGRGIVLFHDIQRRTAEMLPEFLSELYSRGYSVVLLQASDPAAKFNSKLVKKNTP